MFFICHHLFFVKIVYLTARSFKFYSRSKAVFETQVPALGMSCHLPDISLLWIISNTSNFCLDTTKIQYFKFLFCRIFAKFTKFHQIFVHNADHFHPKIWRLFNKNSRQQRTKIVEFCCITFAQYCTLKERFLDVLYTCTLQVYCHSFSNGGGQNQLARLKRPKKPGLNRVQPFLLHWRLCTCI